MATSLGQNLHDQNANEIPVAYEYKLVPVEEIKEEDDVESASFNSEPDDDAM
jgi:hypothetical protein